MADFDKLAGDAEKEVRDHPQQVQEGEQAVDKKLGIGDQNQSGQSSGGDAQNDQKPGNQDQQNS